MKRHTWLFLSFMAACILIIAARTDAGTIVGKVNFKGTKPPVTMITMGADQKCLKLHEGKQVPSEKTVVNPNNTLEWSFVYIKKGLEGKKFPLAKDKKSIEQRGCRAGRGRKTVSPGVPTPRLDPRIRLVNVVIDRSPSR